MSVTNVKRVADVASRCEYLVVGDGTRRRGHLEAGTDRVAAMTCDADSVADFVRLGQYFAQANGRKVEALTYFQSFSLDEFSPDNPDDVNRVHELGVELGRRMGENAPLLVITHIDGEGHDGCGPKVHNHIVRLNHDLETGHALKTHRMHFEVARTNDALMRAEGLSVVERHMVDDKFMSRSDHFEKRRGELDEQGKTFDVALFDKCAEAALADDVRSWDDYTERLAVAGVEVVESSYLTKRNGREVALTGVTYKMLDESGPKPRMRRRKSSKLTPELSKSGVEELIKDREKQRDTQAAQQRAQADLAAAQQRIQEAVLRRDEDDQLAKIHRRYSDLAAGRGQSAAGGDDGEVDFSGVHASLEGIDQRPAEADRRDRSAQREGGRSEQAGRRPEQARPVQHPQHRQQRRRLDYFPDERVGPADEGPEF